MHTPGTKQLTDSSSQTDRQTDRQTDTHTHTHTHTQQLCTFSSGMVTMRVRGTLMSGLLV